MVIVKAAGKKLDFEVRHLALFGGSTWLSQLYREIEKMMLVSQIVQSDVFKNPQHRALNIVGAS